MLEEVKAAKMKQCKAPGIDNIAGEK